MVPVLLSVAAVLFQLASALVKGKKKGEYKFRIWIKQPQQDGSSNIVPLLGQSLESVRLRNDIVDVDIMSSFDIADFSSIGISLVIGAFSVDIASLIANKGNPIIIGYVVLGHLFLLIGVLLFVMLCHMTEPKVIGVESKSLLLKRSRAITAIGLGFLAMMTAFLVVQ